MAHVVTGSARIALLLLASTLLACTQGAAPSAAPSGAGARQTGGDAGPRAKRITAAVRAELPTVSKTLNTIIPGATALDRLVSAGLTTTDDKGVIHPQLADAVPSVDNGQWRVFPDGRMETTWKLRPNARWHDGMAVTPDDLSFAITVGNDRELALFNHSALASLDRVEARDGATVTAYWKAPFIDADVMFGKTFNDDVVIPLPKHILERVYLEDKISFTDNPYWTSEFVGTGPFKVKDWVKGSSVTLAANEAYVLGRPKLDEIEVRFIAEGGTLLANILAGAVDVTVGERNFSLDEVSQLAWPDGKWVPGDRSPIVAFPQLLNPTPPLVSNVVFRRALLMAIDRQEMADTFQPGLALVAHAIISPDLREYADVEPAAVKYAFDLRRAEEMVEGLGYTKGGDGMFVDSSGQRLAMQIRSTTLTENNKSMLSVADYWQRFGLDMERHTIPLARSQEAEYRATFPGFELIRQPRLEVVTRIHSSRARVPENNFRTTGGFNYPRYMNPDFDALIDRFYSTVPWEPRMEALRQIVHTVTDQILVMGMFYSTEANMVNNRLIDVTPTRAWASEQWSAR